MLEPLVSISCLAYNHEPFIRESLNGFLKQKTIFPFEVIIHDDASTDKTSDIIREYEKNYPEIFRPIYQTENQYSKKVSITSTYQFPRARGKYIALCEGDDYWTDPLKLQKQVELLEANPECSMCVAKTEVFENDKYLRTIGDGKKEKYGFMDILYGTYFHTSTYLIRKEYVELYCQADKSLQVGDTSLRYFLSDLGPFVLLNDVVSVYRITGNGVWTSLDEKQKLKGHIKLHNTFYKNFKPKYRKEFSSILINEYFQLFLFSLKEKSFRNILFSLIGFLFGMRRNPKYFITFFGQKFKSLLKKFIKKIIGST